MEAARVYGHRSATGLALGNEIAVPSERANKPSEPHVVTQSPSGWLSSLAGRSLCAVGTLSLWSRLDSELRLSLYGASTALCCNKPFPLLTSLQDQQVHGRLQRIGAHSGGPNVKSS
jgi:hypothetical protein